MPSGRSCASRAFREIDLRRCWRTTCIAIGLAALQPAWGGEPRTAAASIVRVDALLTGRYENSAQVALGRRAAGDHPPQHVVIAIEPTPRARWELWHVHMDVDPAVARAAGSDTALDAVWAMHLVRRPSDASLELVPYTLNPSVDEATVRASDFRASQWFSLEACALSGDFGDTRIVAQVAGDEMCVAVGMGLGGKRAFLPSRIEREGDWLHVDISFFGRPWRVDARRVHRP